MNKKEARRLASQAWCQPRTSNKPSDRDLLEEFAIILQRECQERTRAVTELAEKYDHVETQIERLARWILLNAPERIKNEALRVRVAL